MRHVPKGPVQKDDGVHTREPSHQLYGLLDATKLKSVKPCFRCIESVQSGTLRAEAIQPLPAGAFAPLGFDGRYTCYDCASAGTLVRLRLVPSFGHARTVVGNERQEQYRLSGVPMGLVGQGLVRPSKEGDFELARRWLDANDWFGLEVEQEAHLL